MVLQQFVYMMIFWSECGDENFEKKKELVLLDVRSLMLLLLRMVEDEELA